MTTQKKKQLTITQTAKLLSRNGHELIGGSEYDLVNRTARYRIRVDGVVQVMTVNEIMELI